MQSNKTIDQILLELSEALGNPLDAEIDSKFEQDVFRQLRNVDGFTEYLRLTLGKDMQRYFNAVNDDDRNQIKGHYSFAAFLLARLRKEGEFDKLKKDLSGKRKKLA